MRISRSKLEPGMQVADDVIGPGGRLLMPAGTVLSEKHIQAFQSWNVPSANIVDTTGEGGAEKIAPPELDEQEKARILARFAHNDLEDPFIACLFQEVVQRAAHRNAECTRES